MVAASAGNAFGFDGNVAELAGHAVHAVPDFSFEHDAAADSGAEGDDRHIGNSASGTKPLLAEGGDVGVVFEDDASAVFLMPVFLAAQPALDFGADGILVEAGKVGGFAKHSGLHVDDAGDAEADAEKISGRLILRREALNGLTHFGDDVIGSESGLGAEGNFFEKLAGAGDGSDAEVGATQIDSDGEIRHG